MKHTLAAVVVAVMLLAGVSSTASAATCSDFSNQADAQRAKNTRDADHDGIYCVISPR
jgi:hypothetical protein